MPEDAPEVFQEKHYKATDLAKVWGLSPDAIRRLFKNEPGVLRHVSNKQSSKRAYTTLLIPESVVRRVHARLSIPEQQQPSSRTTAVRINGNAVNAISSTAKQPFALGV